MKPWTETQRMQHFYPENSKLLFDGVVKASQSKRKSDTGKVGRFTLLLVSEAYEII